MNGNQWNDDNDNNEDKKHNLLFYIIAAHTAHFKAVSRPIVSKCNSETDLISIDSPDFDTYSLHASGLGNA